MKQAPTLFVCMTIAAASLIPAPGMTQETPSTPAPLPTLTAGAADKSVATVNGHVINEADFITVLAARYGVRCLNALIENLIIKQAADKAGVKADAEDLLRRLISAQRAVDTRAPMTGENFDMWLAKRGLTREYFRTELYHQMLLEEMVADQVTIESPKVAEFYQVNKEQLREPAMMQIAHICVEKEDQAKQIKADIQANKISWEDAAKQYSLDTWTKDEGGDMGFIPQSEDPFVAKAFALKVNGDLSDPVESPMGYHILKRLAYRASRIPPFEEVEESIRQQLERRDISRLAAQKRAEIMQAAKVEIIQQMPLEAAPIAPPPTAPSGAVETP